MITFSKDFEEIQGILDLNVKGIGTKISAALIDMYGGLDKLVNYEPIDFQKVKGIGRKRANMLHDAIKKLK